MKSPADSLPEESVAPISAKEIPLDNISHVRLKTEQEPLSSPPPPSSPHQPEPSDPTNSPVFKVGDKAVYAGVGLVEVQDIEERQIGGQKLECYVFGVPGTNQKMYMPMQNINNGMLRPLLTPDQIRKEVFEILAEPGKEVRKEVRRVWKRAELNILLEKLKSRNAGEMAEALRDLNHMRKSGRKLTEFEIKIYDQGMKHLTREIAVSLGESVEQVRQRINNILNPIKPAP